MNVKNRWIAHVGLGAAAVILVASLGILVFQGAQNDSLPMNTVQPAVKSAAAPATGPQLTGAHNEGSSAVGL